MNTKVGNVKVSEFSIVGSTTYTKDSGPEGDGIIEEDMHPVTDIVISVRALLPSIVAVVGIDTNHE